MYVCVSKAELSTFLLELTSWRLLRCHIEHECGFVDAKGSSLRVFLMSSYLYLSPVTLPFTLKEEKKTNEVNM